MISENSKIVIGRFGACYGIRGWIKLTSFTESPAMLFSYRPCYVRCASRWQSVEIVDHRVHGSGFVVSVVNVNSRDEAGRLANSEIYIDADLLPPLKDDRFYWKDLIGCAVVTTQNYHLGEVIGLMETGSNDVLIVKSRLDDAFHMKERLLPFVDHQVIKRVDLNAKLIEVSWDPAF